LREPHPKNLYELERLVGQESPLSPRSGRTVKRDANPVEVKIKKWGPLRSNAPAPHVPRWPGKGGTLSVVKGMGINAKKEGGRREKFTERDQRRREGQPVG